MANLTGTAPEQIPTNADLGRMAFMEPEALVLKPQVSATPNNPGDMVFQLTSNTALAVKVMGSDGVIRSVTLTLA